MDIASLELFRLAKTVQAQITWPSQVLKYMAKSLKEDGPDFIFFIYR